MAKIRKNQRRKRYQFNKNRKRMKKSDFNKVKCQTVEKQWDYKKSTVNNLKQMGLAFNLNKINSNSETTAEPKIVPHVIKQLEEEASALREKSYRIPKNQADYLIYLLDKYGEDYKAMARDKKNHAQLTWKQFRSKVNTFKNIPQQYNEYLEKRQTAGLAEIPCKTIEDDEDLF